MTATPNITTPKEPARIWPRWAAVSTGPGGCGRPAQYVGNRAPEKVMAPQIRKNCSQTFPKTAKNLPPAALQEIAQQVQALGGENGLRMKLHPEYGVFLMAQPHDLPHRGLGRDLAPGRHGLP